MKALGTPGLYKWGIYKMQAPCPAILPYLTWLSFPKREIFQFVSIFSLESGHLGTLFNFCGHDSVPL